MKGEKLQIYNQRILKIIEILGFIINIRYTHN